MRDWIRIQVKAVIRSTFAAGLIAEEEMDELFDVVSGLLPPDSSKPRIQDGLLQSELDSASRMKVKSIGGIALFSEKIVVVQHTLR